MPSTILPERAAEVIEVQVLADIDHGKSHCFVLESTPSADASTIEYLVKKGANLRLNDNDDATARTEVSTEFDENSLREKFSFGNLYLADTGTFTSKHSSFDTSRSSTLRDRENSFSKKITKNASLLDLDDDDDLQRDALYRRRFFGSNVSISISERSQSVIDESLSTMSRSHFYGDCSPKSNTHSNGLPYYALSRSRFAKGTLDTDSPIDLYRVSCSESQEPLSCQDKLEVCYLISFYFIHKYTQSHVKLSLLFQPVVSSCDEEFWNTTDRDEGGKPIDDNVGCKKNVRDSRFENMSDSVLSAISCFLCRATND